MMTFNILVVEDDQIQFDAYNQALEDDDLQSNYNLMHAVGVDAAENLLSANGIHAAILDLKIPKSSGAEADKNNGINYLKQLTKEKQFPIVVVSANISSLTDDDPNLPRHLKKLDRKAGVHSKVFEHFEEIKDLLHITPIIPKAIEEIKSELQNSFWDLWGHWTELNARFKPEDTKRLKIFLKRYICSNLIEKWMANDLFNEMHHTEFYTYPLAKDRIHTGDILNINNDYWIVVTAPCDLSNNEYPENLTILKCEKIDLESYKDIVKPFRENQTNKKKQTQTDIVRKCFTNPPVSKHYLPPCEKGGRPSNVLFKHIRTVSFGEINRDELKQQRVASLSSHFLPYLLQRYGAYVSRIGQAEIGIDGYLEYLLEVVPE